MAQLRQYSLVELLRLFLAEWRISHEQVRLSRRRSTFHLWDGTEVRSNTHLIPEEMVLDVNVLGPPVELRIVCHSNGRLVVFQDSGGFPNSESSLCIHIHSWTAVENATYSVDRATVLCFLLFHPPAIRNM